MTKKEKMAILQAIHTICDKAYEKVSSAQCDAREISAMYGNRDFSVRMKDVQDSINDVNKAIAELTVTNTIRAKLFDELEKNGINLYCIEEI